MLKIEISPTHPQYALTDCAALLALVRNGLNDDVAPDTLQAMSELLGAVQAAMGTVQSIVTAAMRDERGMVRPMVPEAAPEGPQPTPPRLTARGAARPQAARA